METNGRGEGKALRRTSAVKTTNCDQCGQKWSVAIRNGRKWTVLDRKLVTVDGSGQKIVNCGRFWSEMDGNGRL